MSERAEREAVTQFAKKSELAKTLGMGAQGQVPQLKRRERSQLLGQFRERVLWGATAEALSAGQIHPSFASAVEDNRAERLLVRSDFTKQAMPYIRRAAGRGIGFTFVQSPEFVGDVALVLVSRDALEGHQEAIV